MGLFTKEIEAALERYPLYSQDDKGREAVAVCRLVLQGTPWAWYVLEGNRIELDEAAANDAKIKAGPTWQLFGIVCSNTAPAGEYGYFLLAELEAIQVKAPVIDEADNVIGNIPLKVELDPLFSPGTALEDIPGLQI